MNFQDVLTVPKEQTEDKTDSNTIQTQSSEQWLLIDIPLVIFKVDFPLTHTHLHSVSCHKSALIAKDS